MHATLYIKSWWRDFPEWFQVPHLSKHWKHWKHRTSLDSANCLSSSALNSLGELKTTCQLWSNAAVSTEQQVRPKRKHQYINQVIRTRIAQPETHNAKQRQIQLIWVLTNAPVALFLVVPLTWRWPRLFSTLRFWPLPMVQVSNHQSRNWPHSGRKSQVNSTSVIQIAAANPFHQKFSLVSLQAWRSATAVSFSEARASIFWQACRVPTTVPIYSNTNS